MWVCGSGCITSDGSHRRGTGQRVGGMCHRHHSRVVSAVEALDFRAARLNLSLHVVVWSCGAVWVCGEHAVTQFVNTVHRAGVMLRIKLLPVALRITSCFLCVKLDRLKTKRDKVLQQLFSPLTGSEVASRRFKYCF